MNNGSNTQNSLTSDDLKDLILSFQTCNSYEHIKNSLSEMTDEEKIRLLFEIKEAKKSKKDLIYLMTLENLFKSDNGLLDMVIRKLYPDAVLSSVIMFNLTITVSLKRGNNIEISLLNDNRFTPELLQESYNKLGDKNPAKVAEIVNEFSNLLSQILQLRETLSTLGLLDGKDILEVLKNEEIKTLLLRNKVQVSGLLKDLERLYNISCEEEKIKPSEHLSPFDKRGIDI